MQETARRPRRGDRLELTIDSLTHDGRGIARPDGKVVFVADALPGERVIATVLRRRRNHDEARLDDVLESVAGRTEPRCRFFGMCGGCSLQHLEPGAQVAAKQDWLLDSLERIGGVQPGEVLEPLRADVWGYRRRARLGVRDVAGKGRVLVGFRERSKPYVTDMTSCEVLAPPAARLIAPLSDLIGRLSLRSQLPQIEVAAADNATALVMRVLAEPAAEDLALLRTFATENAVEIWLQTGGLDTVRPLSPTAPTLYYRLEAFDLRLEFGATDFIQVNGAINEQMVQRVYDLTHLRPGERLLDLYCGLGNFTLPLACSGATVVGVEGAATLVARARVNARLNGLAERTGFHVADLSEAPGDAAWAAGPYDKVLLDPPRSGAAAMVGELARLGASRVVYVSCHPATLARDAGTLVREGGYRLRAAGVMDMFPHTAHVESIAVFER